jgi:glycogen(starch) synthase
MKSLQILIVSVPLHPMVGGMETATDILARELVNLDQSVTVITLTPSSVPDHHPYQIVRMPTMAKLINWIRVSDVVIAQGATLKLTWPAFLLRTPLIIVHQAVYSQNSRFSFLRNAMINTSQNVAVSKWVERSVPGPVVTIYNTYDFETFKNLHLLRRYNSLLFVGRLVPEKGILTLLSAIHLLKADGFEYTLTIVGDGPLRDEVQRFVSSNDLESLVTLAGTITGSALNHVYNEHHIAIFPSLWEEPFGIVALEAIACGSLVIGTQSGGLPEAIGNCGLIVPNGDIQALSDAIHKLVQLGETPFISDLDRQKHLSHFHPSSQARQFLQLASTTIGIGT